MERTLQAVYTNGVLRPVEPLHLEEMQEVTVTITSPSGIDDDLPGYFPPEKWAEASQDRIAWGGARRALSNISGCLSDVVVTQRQGR